MLNKLKLVQNAIGQRAQDSREVMARLDSLHAEQSEIKQYIALIMQSETKLIEAQNYKIGRLHPSKMAWLHASIWLVLSAVAIVVGAVLNTADSSLSSQAASLHQSAQTDRVAVVEQLLEDFEPLNQVNSLGVPFLSKLPQSDLLKIMNTEVNVTHDNLDASEKEMAAANRSDAQADHIENEAAHGQLLSQILLGLGSAFFGAVLGWVITQILAEVCWREKDKPESADKAERDKHRNR